MDECCTLCGSLVPVGNVQLHMLRCTGVDHDGGVRRPATDATGWACPRCTFENDSAAAVCEMCLGSRLMGDEPLSQEWTCRNCTWGNIPGSQVCERCGTTRQRLPTRMVVGPGQVRVETRSTMSNGHPVTMITRRTTGGASTAEAQELPARPSPGSSPSQSLEDLMGPLFRGGLLGAAAGGLVSAVSGQRAGSNIVAGAALGAVMSAVVDDIIRSAGPPSTGLRSSVGPGAGGDLSWDNLSFERALQLFGSPERPRAPPELVTNLPTHALSAEEVRKLPEAARNCTICMDAFQENHTTKRLPCMHIFHDECISRWLARANSCPICNHTM